MYARYQYEQITSCSARGPALEGIRYKFVHILGRSMLVFDYVSLAAPALAAPGNWEVWKSVYVVMFM
jgi:hypothetical protein